LFNHRQNESSAHASPVQVWKILASGIVILALFGFPSPCATAGTGLNDPELSRPVRPWESVSALGQRAALLGDESGRLEAWVYPLKILRNFQLRFLTEGNVVPGTSLARTITVRPESTTILYANDTFTARETLFVPVREQGAIIAIEVSTSQPLEIRASFESDFQLMWPAEPGGSHIAWDNTLHAFSIGDDLNRFAAFVGSPEATDFLQDSDPNNSPSKESSFLLGTFQTGRETRRIFLAGSTKGQDEAARTYQQLSGSYAELLRDAENYYDAYLKRTVQLELPDKNLQRAYDWSRISVVQGLVENPDLGTGLVAGYRASGDNLRPGFAWFFGRDALWTSLALNAEGDFATTRTALDFLLKYQRADGKIAHEIAQSADFVPWFQKYPYGYASADATPLFLIAVSDYVSRSGDLDFARTRWEQIWKCYQFLASTYDADGFAQNHGGGHGWVEGGPLLPADVELYQAGLGIEAERAVAHLAGLLGKADVGAELSGEFGRQRLKLNEAFWSVPKSYFAFARNQNNQLSDPLTVLSAVPMWFHLLDDEKAEKTINRLAGSEIETDWGTRILSARDPHYGASGYHFGSVWPLFTGWAAVGEYRYHRTLPAFANLEANAMLALDGSLGHTTEVLSGDSYTPLASSTSDQIWSAAMVISPILRGMMDLDVDAGESEISFSPHIPADWNAFAIRNVQIGLQSVDLVYRRTSDQVVLETTLRGNTGTSLIFSPALSLRAAVQGAELDGRPVPFQVFANEEDQHVSVKLKLRPGANVLRIRVKDDFGVSVPYRVPELGSASRGLRVISESWSATRDSLSVYVEGIPGEFYDLGATSAGEIRSVDGAQLLKSGDGQTSLRVQFPDRAPDTSAPTVAHNAAYTPVRVVIHFYEKPAVARKNK
jgi:glycogen debranching enzyme